MIYRHFDLTYTPERIRKLPPFQGFCYQAEQGLDDIAADLADGKRADSYFNILTMPEPNWHSVWLDFVRDTCPEFEGVKSWNRNRGLMDWRSMDTGKIAGMCSTIVEVTKMGRFGAFLDLAFLRYQYWMFLPTGRSYDDFDPNKWVYGERRMRRMIQQLKARGVRTISNGSWEEDHGALYFEYAERNGWKRALGLWLADTDNEYVLSVNGADRLAVDRLIQLHDKHPEKWIAFSGDDQACDEAYKRAASPRPSDHT